MTEENREERKRRGARGEEASDAEQADVTAAPHPDASHYMLQPTSYKLNADVQGEVPPNRFQEEVLKGSDEDSGEGEEAHPPENRPAMGIGPDDELPDTTGRAPLKAQKRS